MEKSEAKIASCLQPKPKVLVSCRGLNGESNKELFDYMGSHSKRDGDKLKAMNVNLEDGKKVNAPILADCPVNIECKVVDSIVTGSHEMFIGKIEYVHADANLLNLNGDIDFSQINFL